MNEKIKNYLGAALILGIVVGAWALWSYAYSYAKFVKKSNPSGFTVSAEGKMVAVPDIFQFSFGVVTQGGKDIVSLQKDNTEKTNKAIEFVKSQGIDAKDIETQSYNVEPRYQYSSCPPTVGVICPPAEIVGYTINQSVRVKIRNFEKIGNILSGVVQAGANSVSGLVFTIDDPTSLQNKARAEAIEKAQMKAETIAKAAGFKLGDLLSLDEGSYFPPVYAFRESDFGKGGAAEPLPAIEPGSQEVKITVTLRYAIE